MRAAHGEEFVVDGDGIESRSADRAAPTGPASAYRDAPRSAVGARISIRA
ncbi:MAG: hypothetical protein R3F21_22400 [Myxococcota bacterium]